MGLTPVAIWIAWSGLPGWVWVAQFLAAAFSDLYDGKLARRWGVVTPGLRQADSLADTFYLLGVLACFQIAHADVVRDHAWGIGVVIAIEGARYPLDWWKFGRGASYHALSAKSFAAALVVAAVALMGFGVAVPFLWIALAIGLVSELEGVAISLVLPRWTHDVRHFGVALRLRREHLSPGGG